MNCVLNLETVVGSCFLLVTGNCVDIYDFSESSSSFLK
jgi:hypothetical protein